MKETAKQPTALSSASARPVLKPFHAALCRQDGVIGILLALLLPVLIIFIAFSLELGRIYNRKVEMQALADSVAISAARNLNGTKDGISDALAAARDVVEGGSDSTARLRYQYRDTMLFSDGALKFSKSPDGASGWLNADAAKASPEGVAYVKVDTNDFSGDYGTIKLLFTPFLNNLPSLKVSHSAVAGRQRLKLTPLAICAMSKDASSPFKKRDNPDNYSELTEYGFRRGVSYNLLKLSPHTSTAVNYVFDPISLPPKDGNFAISTIGPYVCTGTVELPKVIDQTLNLQSGFPISSLVNQLNSRFNLSSGQCSTVAAPPDYNVKQFTVGNINWMNTPYDQVADTAPTSGRLETIADLDPPNNQSSPTHYGPLWVYARPVPWSEYAPGETEPAKGYAPFKAETAVWNSLYSTGPVLNSYPKDPSSGLDSPAYFSQITKPTSSYPGVWHRRVLNIPLLECATAGAPGKVVAIGRFFMTVPANTNGIYAEFAGVSRHEEVAGSVELYQ